MIEFDFGELYEFNDENFKYNGPTWTELIGLDGEKEKLLQFLKAANRIELFEKTRLRFRPSILLSGPPGTGKTTLTLAFGKKEKIPVFMLLSTKIIKSRLGESGDNLSKAIKQVKKYASENVEPIILFIDEFDSFARERDDPQEIGEIKRLVNTLLTELDSLMEKFSNILLIAATNHEDTLDSAAFRRFAVRINLGLPSAEMRSYLWNEYEHRLKSEIPDLEWTIEALVAKTDGYTAADIERLVLNAVLHYIYHGESTISTDLLVKQTTYVIPTSKHVKITEKSGVSISDYDLRILNISDPVKTKQKMNGKAEK